MALVTTSLGSSSSTKRSPFLSYKSASIFVNTDFLTGALVVVGLVGGTSLLMWLGDQITSKGIGNGISIIIFIFKISDQNFFHPKSV